MAAPARRSGRAGRLQLGAQRTLTRRHFSGLALLLLSGCGKRERAAVLEGIVREVVAELARDLVAETRALHAAVSALARAPGADTRERARRALSARGAGLETSPGFS
jgi:predicted lipoprotein